jgi:hypothetical protein
MNTSPMATATSSFPMGGFYAFRRGAPSLPLA